MTSRIFAALVLGVVALATVTDPASAVEHRLQVVSVYEESFVSVLKPGELNDGRSGPGLTELMARLDRGEFPSGAMLYDRHVVPAPEDVARAYGATPIRTDVRFGGRRGELWDEARWDGPPGALTVWIVTPSSRQPQEVRRLALKGSGELRQFQPYRVSFVARRLDAASVPLSFLRRQEDRGPAAGKLLARVVKLDHGIAALVALNDDVVYPDRVYLIVRQRPEPTTYKAVLAWRKREGDQELPNGGDANPPR
jgi:hypothetical protein